MIQFGVSLEIFQTHSKLEILIFFLFSFLIFGKLIEFGVSLEILQTLSKLTPNSV